MLLSSDARRPASEGLCCLHEWLRAVDQIAGLHPRAVVAGHKDKNRPDEGAILDETRQYLRDVIRLLENKRAAREFYDQMVGLYPDRLNPGVVWLGMEQHQLTPYDSVIST
jgi:hypothetical protein